MLPVVPPAATLCGLGGNNSPQPPHEHQSDHRNQRQLAEAQTPAEDRVISGQIERITDAERANERAGIAAHAVQPHGGAPHRGIGGLHRARRERRTVEEDEGKPGDDKCRGED